MKKRSLLWLLSAGMLDFSCGGNEEGAENTEDVIASTEVVDDHVCCSEECADDCEIHAEEKKTCDKSACDKSKCDQSTLDKTDCDKADCHKTQCEMSKCDGTNCSESCTVDHT